MSFRGISVLKHDFKPSAHIVLSIRTGRADDEYNMSCVQSTKELDVLIGYWCNSFQTYFQYLSIAFKPSFLLKCQSCFLLYALLSA